MLNVVAVYIFTCILLLMNGAANTGLYTVVANGTVSVPMTKAAAERVARNLRSGKIAGRKFASPIAAKVVAV